MQDAPKGVRLHIGVFGRCNVGKSSLVNAVAGQAVSIVADTPGTTADPVEKTMELSSAGPVVFIDTAGLDDAGEIGALRTERTLRAMDRTDVALVVTDSGRVEEHEERILGLLAQRSTPCLVVFGKADLRPPAQEVLDRLQAAGTPSAVVSAATGQGVPELKEAIIRLAPDEALEEPRLLAGLAPPGGLAVLVAPMDLGAPKGRIILPQVQAVRDALDSDAACVVVKENGLRGVLDALRGAPDLVVCDSQVVRAVADTVPAAVPMTTFSILMARLKGDLTALTRGAAAMERLRPGSRVLIAEACSHHPSADDIGRIKLPRWIRQAAGDGIGIEVVAGKDFQEDVGRFDVIVHCGACVLNRKNMLLRLRAAERQGVPMTNYGVAISLLQGVLPRVLAPFPEALAALEEARSGVGEED